MLILFYLIILLLFLFFRAFFYLFIEIKCIIKLLRFLKIWNLSFSFFFNNFRWIFIDYRWEWIKLILYLSLPFFFTVFPFSLNEFLNLGSIFQLEFFIVGVNFMCAWMQFSILLNILFFLLFLTYKNFLMLFFVLL